MRSGPGEARTILLLHIISARPSKQPRMVGGTVGVYSFGLIFVFLQEQIKDIIIKDRHSSHPYLILSASSGCMQKFDSECFHLPSHNH